jgi:transglutaminase-like putative cysteine protease
MQALYHPAFGRVLPTQESYVPDDADGQVAATIDLMRQYVVEDAQSLEIRRDAHEAVGTIDYGHIPQREIVDRVFRYVKRRLSFVGDERLSSWMETPGSVPIIEVLVRPKQMAAMCGDGRQCSRLGDCDDFSMYTAALLTALGIRTAFVTIAADRVEVGKFSHVYVAAYTNEGERIAVDTSHGPHPGWEHAPYTRIQEWPIGGMGVGTVVGVVLLMYLWARGGI